MCEERGTTKPLFPISRDPLEGGTPNGRSGNALALSFQFLGIPPKGERPVGVFSNSVAVDRFQFLGIPPKGEQIE